MDKRLSTADRIIHQAALELRIDVVYLCNSSGDCVASSNAEAADSFLGSNFSDREYFRQAIQGSPGRQYAVGRVSKIPGLYFSAPVSGADGYLGTVVTKVNLPRAEFWAEQHRSFLHDRYGVVVVSQNEALLHRTIPDATVYSLTEEQRNSRYLRTEFSALSLTAWNFPSHPELLAMPGEKDPVLLCRRTLELEGLGIWNWHPVSGIRPLIETTLLNWILGTATGWLALALLARRKQRTAVPVSTPQVPIAPNPAVTTPNVDAPPSALAADCLPERHNMESLRVLFEMNEPAPPPPPAAQEDAEPQRPAFPIQPPVINHPELLRRMQDNRERAANFIHRAPAILRAELSRLHSAHATKDLGGLMIASHALKNSAANLCAERMVACASQAEKLAREGRLEDFGPLLSELDRQLEDFDRLSRSF